MTNGASSMHAPRALVAPGLPPPLSTRTTHTRLLSGYFEGDNGEGSFEPEQADDGRSFRGTLTDSEGETREWVGTRVTEACGEWPPRRVWWIWDSLLGRGLARLAQGEAEAALEDARAATTLSLSACSLSAAGRLAAAS